MIEKLSIPDGIYEVTASDDAFGQITEDLNQIGYLQNIIKTPSFFKYLAWTFPTNPESTSSLNFTTSARSEYRLYTFLMIKEDILTALP